MMKRARFLFENKSLFIEWLLILATIFVLFWLFRVYTLSEIGQLIVNWNHQWEWSTRWYGLLAIYWIEIVLLAFVWDLFWYRLDIHVRTFYNKFSHLWVKKKWLLMRLIRFKYGFGKLRYYMRVAFYFGGSSKQRTGMIDYVIRPTPIDMLKIIFSFIFGKASILAGILTLFTFDSSIFNTVQNTAISLWNEGIVFVWDNFTKLSAVVGFVLIIFLWYFISRQGIVRRAVAQANRKKLEDVIQLHRKLSHFAIEIILKGSRNLEYAINCYDLLVDYWTYKRFPNASKAGYSEHLWYRWSYRESEHFQFKDIDELTLFTNEIENMRLPDNKDISRWFSKYKYELNMASIKLLFSSLEEFDHLLFTKKGFNEMITVTENEVPEQFDAKMIEDVDHFKNVLEKNIIDGLEFIYVLYRYLIVLENILHIESDKLGRGLRSFTNKE